MQSTVHNTDLLITIQVTSLNISATTLHSVDKEPLMYREIQKHRNPKSPTAQTTNQRQHIAHKSNTVNYPYADQTITQEYNAHHFKHNPWWHISATKLNIILYLEYIPWNRRPTLKQQLKGQKSLPQHILEYVNVSQKQPSTGFMSVCRQKTPYQTSA